MNLNEKGNTMRKSPHKISLKSPVEKKLQRIICSQKTTSEIIEELLREFPQLGELQKQETELLIMQRALDAVEQIKENLERLERLQK